MLDLEKYTYHGVTLYVRGGAYNTFDRGIVREVQREYLWDRIDAGAAMTVVDCGAHIGSWSAYLRHINPACRIITIEADAENAMICGLNHYGDEHVYPYHAACRYNAGDVIIARHNENSGGHIVLPAGERWKAEGDPAREIRQVPMTVKIEDVMARHGFERCNLLKMDVEGSEFDILINLPVGALMRIDTIVGEHHSTREWFADTVGQRLAAYGFDVEYIPHPNPDVVDLGMFLARRG